MSAATTAEATTPVSGAEILARIKPRLREGHTQICLRPDLLMAWEAANEELLEQREGEGKSRRLADGGISAASKKLAKRITEIESEIEAASVVFRFRAMPKDRWQALCDNHPPRKSNEFDAFAGYDRDAVVDAALRECLYDPDFDDESWTQFVSTCNPSEWAELRRLTNEVNGRVSGAPKSALASQVLTRRASTSE